jgi:AraC-like DNA-binding protein
MNETQTSDLCERLIRLMDEKKVFAHPDVNISSLVTELKTNTNYLSKLIHDNFHLNFNDYINRLRVDYACQLLNNGSLKNITVQELYHKSGFATRSTFYVAFRKHTGTTPSAFKKSLHTIEYQ